MEWSRSILTLIPSYINNFVPSRWARIVLIRGIIYHLYPEPHRFEFLNLGNPKEPKLPKILTTILSKLFNLSKIWIKLLKRKISKLNLTTFLKLISTLMMRDTVDDGSIFSVVWHLYECQMVTEYAVRTKYLQLDIEMLSSLFFILMILVIFCLLVCFVD